MPGIDHIVVGVDGSDTSRSALEWAYDEAAHHGATLTVLTAWHAPTLPISPPAAALEEGYETLPRRSALTTLDELVAELDDRDPAVDVRTSIEEGSAAEVLIERSKGCDLLVVGSHGHGGCAGMLLGSVTNRLVAHAHCPVVAVR